MKQRKNNFLTIGFIALSLFAVGCSSKKSSNNQTDTLSGRSSDTANGSTSIGTPPDDSDWGAEAYLDFVDGNAFEDFSGYAADDLVNERVYVKLYEVVEGGEAYYEGEVRIAYDYTFTHGGFSPTPGKVETYYKFPRFEAEQYTEDELEDNPKALSKAIHGIRFNKFYNNSGEQYFVGFFEEPDFYDFAPWNWDPSAKAGSIMVIINKDDDDSGWSGSVWYKNYGFTDAVKPTFTRCWDISEGPFACRDFLYQDKIRPDVVSKPSVYKKLGSFYELNPDKAFGN